MKKSRPVFESFGAFVKAMNEAMNEAETTGTLDALKKLLGGGLRFGKAEKAKFDAILDKLTSLGVTQEQMDDAKSAAQDISDYFSEGEEQGVELAEPIAGDDEPDLSAASGHPQVEMIMGQGESRRAESSLKIRGPSTAVSDVSRQEFHS